MSTRKDYYSILGVDKTATKDEIKKAYRKLAIQFHPDKYSNESEEKKKEAEEKFKGIAESYSIIGDEEKRKEYDNPRSSFNGGNMGDFGGMSMDDILRTMANGGNFRQERKVNKGQSIRISVTLSLEEIYNGVHKKLRYKRMTKCNDCNGKGTIEKDGIQTCPDCGGVGTQFIQQGPWQQMSTCGRCQGSGKIVTKPCKKCNGLGIHQEMNEIEIDIPKGVQDGMQLVMENYGHAPLHNDGINGNLLIIINESSHNEYIRSGNDLIITIELPVIDAILGSERVVTTINGKQLTMKIPQGVESETQFKFGGQGMPIYGNNGYGNMIGIIRLKMPKQLSDEEKCLFLQLKEKENLK